MIRLITLGSHRKIAHKHPLLNKQGKCLGEEGHHLLDQKRFKRNKFYAQKITSFKPSECSKSSLHNEAMATRGCRLPRPIKSTFDSKKRLVVETNPTSIH